MARRRRTVVGRRLLVLLVLLAIVAAGGYLWLGHGVTSPEQPAALLREWRAMLADRWASATTWWALLSDVWTRLGT